MQLTKLRAAPVRQAEVPPCAPAGRMDGGTASQLIRSVRPAKAMRRNVRYSSGMRRGIGVVAVTASCLAGCGGSPTGPSSVEGSYRLVELNGQGLPYDHLIGCCIYSAGSLALQSERYEASITFENKNHHGVSTAAEQGSYSLSGTSIKFVRTAGDFPLSLHNAHVEGSSIRVMLGGNGPGAADQFRAVFSR